MMQMETSLADNVKLFQTNMQTLDDRLAQVLSRSQS